jgi:hypothetical protein
METPSTNDLVSNLNSSIEDVRDVVVALRKAKNINYLHDSHDRQ